MYDLFFAETNIDTIKEVIKEKTGQEITTNFIRPIMQSIYNEDPNLEATYENLKILDHRTIEQLENRLSKNNINDDFYKLLEQREKVVEPRIKLDDSDLFFSNKEEESPNIFLEDDESNTDILNTDESISQTPPKTLYLHINSQNRNPLTTSLNPFTINFDYSFDNIKSLQIMEIIIPNIGIELINEPFFWLSINELRPNYINTNAITKLYIKAYHPNLKFIRLEPLNGEIVYNPSEFTSLTITIKCASGKILQFPPNLIPIKNLVKAANNVKIEPAPNVGENISLISNISYIHKPITISSEVKHIQTINGLTRIEAEGLADKVSAGDYIIIDNIEYKIKGMARNDIVIDGIIDVIPDTIAYSNNHQPVIAKKKQIVYMDNIEVHENGELGILYKNLGTPYKKYNGQLSFLRNQISGTIRIDL